MKRFVRFHLFFLLTLAGLAFVVQPALAAKPDPTPPGGHLNITEVFVNLADLSNPIFNISGEDLDFGGPLTVTLGGFGPLDITSADGTLIVAELPLSGPIPDGDYLLTVSRGTGQSHNDEYDLTVGTGGSQGPKTADSVHYIASRQARRYATA